MFLIFASLYRNCGGYVWSYQANNYFKNVWDQSSLEIASYLGVIPMIAGSIGCLLGGLIADTLVKRQIEINKNSGVKTHSHYTAYLRIILLIFSDLVCFPFACGVLLLSPPYGYYCLIGMYLVSEWWIPISAAIVIDLSPLHLKSSVLSVYYFVVNMAAFAPYFVTPVERIVGSYKWAVFILFPCIYGSSAFFFALVWLTFRRDVQKVDFERDKDVDH